MQLRAIGGNGAVGMTIEPPLRSAGTPAFTRQPRRPSDPDIARAVQLGEVLAR